ncbi:MAG: HAMP domain-containing histidine kinase [Chloroflexi bacterium]|nr:HAMP domain-containing histidine kinase [Chloroflexota bacterium]
MNRLWVRLTLAFVAVTLVTVTLVALLAGWRVDAEFRHFLEQQPDDQTTVTTPIPGIGRGQGMMEGRGMMRGPGPMMTPQGQNFLNRLNVVLVLAALGAGVVGAAAGVVISRTIAAPLNGLAQAAQGFATDRRHRAPVHGADEIADVARAFNTMADELQRAETLRRDLMADIAHELRTPLTVMQGNLRALLDGIYPLELREIATIYDETRLLSRLVADLRELALAEAGQLPLNLRAIELAPILQGAVEQFSVAAEAQDTTVELADIPLTPVQADADRVAQVLHNLLANALRHTPSGRITVSGEHAGDRVKIVVSDTGEGIPAADLPYLFDRFYRGDEARSGSTGLGLAIAKAWVEAMDGSIGAESRAGQGSRFWFTLKAA